MEQKQETDAWEATGLFVGQEGEDAHLRLSKWVTSIVGVTNPGLSFGFWKVSIYEENNRNAKFKKLIQIKCHTILYSVIYIINSQ